MPDIETLKENPIAKSIASEGAAQTSELSGYVSRITKTSIEIVPDLTQKTTISFAKKDVLNFIDGGNDREPATFLLRAGATLSVQSSVPAEDFTMTALRKPAAPGGPGGGGGRLDKDLQCLLDYVGESNQCLADYWKDLMDPDVSDATAEVRYNSCNTDADRHLKVCRRGGIFAPS